MSLTPIPVPIPALQQPNLSNIRLTPLELDCILNSIKQLSISPAFANKSLALLERHSQRLTDKEQLIVMKIC
jgi:hypothetical protein